MKLRPYQQEAHDKVIEWVKKTPDPCVIEAATGAGKSIIIAAIAETLNTISKGKHILCLAPSSELVVQNYEKYLNTGNKASICSASAGTISTKHPVVFGTPGTVINRIEKFDDRFCAVVIDEAHGISGTIKKIIAEMQKSNEHLRVIGLSATPYRLGTGYIYAIDENSKTVSETRNPYFKKLVYRVTSRDLIDMGFLTRPVVGAINSEHYDTSNLKLNKLGKFDQTDIDKAFIGHGRKTAAIIADIIKQSADRRGIIIFAATIQHAQECMASLPPELSILIIGDTNKKDRKKLIGDYKLQKYKYIVNVGVLTTGFDAPHIDVVALLRPSESAGLISQMIGRGMRLFEGKVDFLILDYAENIERHFPEGDLFSPNIETKKESSGQSIDALCPSCGNTNNFAPIKNEKGYRIDQYGYFVDLDGVRIKSEYGDFPAHYGRRCQFFPYIHKGKPIQCEYRWTSKKCPECDEDNDIAARYCCSCKTELVDPNAKLVDFHKPAVYDPYSPTTEELVSWWSEDRISRNGSSMKVVFYAMQSRTIEVFYVDGLWKTKKFFEKTEGGHKKPDLITYKKDKNGYWEVSKYIFNDKESVILRELRRMGFKLEEKRPIQHGVQLRYTNNRIVNIYNTGTVLPQGQDIDFIHTVRLLFE